MKRLYVTLTSESTASIIAALNDIIERLHKEDFDIIKYKEDKVRGAAELIHIRRPRP